MHSIYVYVNNVVTRAVVEVDVLGKARFVGGGRGPFGVTFSAAGRAEEAFSTLYFIGIPRPVKLVCVYNTRTA